MLKIPRLQNLKLSIDVGSALTKVTADEKVIWWEPTCLTINEQSHGLSLGQSATLLSGKTPDGINVVYPVVRATTIDPVWLEEYLQLLKKQLTSNAQSLVVKVGWLAHLPDVLSPAEQGIWKKCFIKALGRVSFVSTSQAIENLAVKNLLPDQSVIIMLGDQNTGVFVLNNQKVIQSFSWQWGLHSLLTQIEAVVTQDYQVAVSQLTLREILSQVSNLQNNSIKDRSLVIQAKSLINHASVSQIVTSDKFKTSLRFGLDDWLWWLQSCVSQISETAYKELITQGVWLIGGGASLMGLSSLISETLYSPVQVLSEPELAIVRGLSS